MKGIEVNSFEDLIERLEACSTINHPTRPWTEDFREDVKSEWEGKKVELKNRVEKLESKIKQS